MLKLPEAWVWDFWLVPAAESPDGEYHLFFLYASRALHDPHRRHRRAAVGHARSADLRQWERLADALVHGDAPAFDDVATWTGSVVRAPDGRWFMFYTGASGRENGLVQRIGLATSTDLLCWEKHSANPILEADARWYEKFGDALPGPGGTRTAPWFDEAWRDPWVFRDSGGDGWHMLITARANHGPADERGVVGHARSSDLLNWEAMPPLSEPGDGFGQLEVFQLINIDGRDFLIFNCLAGEFAHARTARDGGPGGIWIAAAESTLGPFDIAGAVPIADERYYVGKVVQDQFGDWVLLAFLNDGPDGMFVGAITDPMPLRVSAKGLELTDDVRV